MEVKAVLAVLGDVAVVAVLGDAGDTGGPGPACFLAGLGEVAGGTFLVATASSLPTVDASDGAAG